LPHLPTRGGMVVKSRFRDQSVRARNPIPPDTRLMYVKSDLPLMWSGSLERDMSTLALNSSPDLGSTLQGL
ncbi:hypothetical protein AVEN_165485-1, partial [Araneus ventricosus]